MGRDSSDGRALLVLALIVLGAIAYRGLSSNPNFCDTNSDNLQLKELASLSADPSSPTNKDLLRNGKRTAGALRDVSGPAGAALPPLVRFERPAEAEGAVPWTGYRDNERDDSAQRS